MVTNIAFLLPHADNNIIVGISKKIISQFFFSSKKNTLNINEIAHVKPIAFTLSKELSNRLPVATINIISLIPTKINVYIVTTNPPYIIAFNKNRNEL